MSDFDCVQCRLPIAHNALWHREGVLLLHEECVLPWTQETLVQVRQQRDEAIDEARRLKAELSNPRNSQSGPARYWRDRATKAEARLIAIEDTLGEARALAEHEGRMIAEIAGVLR